MDLRVCRLGCSAQSITAAFSYGKDSTHSMHVAFLESIRILSLVFTVVVADMTGMGDYGYGD